MTQISVEEVRSSKITEITVSGAVLDVGTGEPVPLGWIEHERHYEGDAVVVTAFTPDDRVVTVWTDASTGAPAMPSWLRAVLRSAHCRLPRGA